MRLWEKTMYIIQMRENTNFCAVSQRGKYSFLGWDNISNLELQNKNKIPLMHERWDGNEAK